MGDNDPSIQLPSLSTRLCWAAQTRGGSGQKQGWVELNTLGGGVHMIKHQRSCSSSIKCLLQETHWCPSNRARNDKSWELRPLGNQNVRKRSVKFGDFLAKKIFTESPCEFFALLQQQFAFSPSLALSPSSLLGVMHCARVSAGYRYVTRTLCVYCTCSCWFPSLLQCNGVTATDVHLTPEPQTWTK